MNLYFDLQNRSNSLKSVLLTGIVTVVPDSSPVYSEETILVKLPSASFDTIISVVMPSCVELTTNCEQYERGAFAPRP